MDKLNEAGEMLKRGKIEPEKTPAEKAKELGNVPMNKEFIVQNSLNDPNIPAPAWTKNPEGNQEEERDYAKEAKVVLAPKPA